jgi:hypothetical protein
MRMMYLATISIIILLLVSGCVGNRTVNNTVNNTNVSKNPENIKTPVVKNTNNTSKDTNPPATVSLISSSMSTNWIKWSWTNPDDADFNYNNIYIDGKFKQNQSQNYYNLTGLKNASKHTISVRTVDKSKNMNLRWVNSTNSTYGILKDTFPPSQIDNLNATVDKTSINWTWDNPDEEDFSYSIIYIDGKFITNVNKPVNHYLLSGLTQNTQKMISVRTVDKAKNINLLWKNDTETTAADNTPPGSVTGLMPILSVTWINWKWTNPNDADFNYVIVYINGVLRTKTTKDSYNTTGLKGGTNYTISLVTADTSNNINGNWVNRTETTLE